MSVEQSADTTVSERLRMALELYESGEEMMRARLARRNPRAPESQLEEWIVSWLRSRNPQPEDSHSAD
jgi:hypothetical protein